ncbi:hypothetical protein BDZ89DRAFT_1136372 [Hymenopellis radicata]|nr:hypothetical protein BDZ89DRAFT_1136372 [Hymenopellis radicata]
MVGTLRRLLSGQAYGDIGDQFKTIMEGRLPLVIYAHNADIMASMIALKAETEEHTQPQYWNHHEDDFCWCPSRLGSIPSLTAPSRASHETPDLMLPG